MTTDSVETAREIINGGTVSRQRAEVIARALLAATAEVERLREALGNVRQMRAEGQSVVLFVDGREAAATLLATLSPQPPKGDDK